MSNQLMINVDKLAKKTFFADYTAILFVSPAGDNTDGSSWTKAFNAIADAIAAASAAVNDNTLILIAPATYAVLVTVAGKRITLMGTDVDGVRILGVNVGPTALIGCKFLNLTLYDAENVCNRSGTVFENVTFEYLAAMGAADLLNIARNIGAPADVIGVVVENCRFYGTPTFTSGIRCHLRSQQSLISNCLFLNCTNGVILTSNANVMENQITKCIFRTIDAAGINIGAACLMTTIQELDFYGCVLMIVDAAATSNVGFDTIHSDSEVIESYPGVSAATLVAVLGGAADTFGAWIQVIPPATLTRPLIIMGIVHEACAVNELFLLDIGLGAAPAAAIGTLALSIASGTDLFKVPIYVPTGTEVRVRQLSRTGVATVNVSLLIKQL